MIAIARRSLLSVVSIAAAISVAVIGTQVYFSRHQSLANDTRIASITLHVHQRKTIWSTVASGVNVTLTLDSIDTLHSKAHVSVYLFCLSTGGCTGAAPSKLKSSALTLTLNQPVGNDFAYTLTHLTRQSATIAVTKAQNTNTATTSPKQVSGMINIYATGQTSAAPSTLAWGAYTSCGNGVTKDNSTFKIDYGDGSSAPMSYVGKSYSIENTTCLENWSAPKHTYSKPGTYTTALYRNGTPVATKHWWLH